MSLADDLIIGLKQLEDGMRSDPRIARMLVNSKCPECGAAWITIRTDERMSAKCRMCGHQWKGLESPELPESPPS